MYFCNLRNVTLSIVHRNSETAVDQRHETFPSKNHGNPMRLPHGHSALACAQICTVVQAPVRHVAHAHASGSCRQCLRFDYWLSFVQAADALVNTHHHHATHKGRPSARNSAVGSLAGCCGVPVYSFTRPELIWSHKPMRTLRARNRFRH